jgi:V8-like Glu-specific endopeptidase
MAVNLARSDFQQLVRLVADFPRLRDVQGRIRFLVFTLEGADRADDVLRQIVFDGDQLNFAIQVVELLADFGRIRVEQVDKEALGIFLNQMMTYTGDETADTLRGLIEKYNMDRPIARAPDLSGWRGDDDEESVQEKVIGENTLRDIRLLQLAWRAAGSVVHIALTAGTGTGFVMGENLVMTNHHVINSPEDAAGATFSFGYQLDVEGKPQKALPTQARAGGLFWTHKELDYTVVEVVSVPEDAPALGLKSEIPEANARVSIIQHPGGHYKKISMQNNFVAFANKQVVQYTTTTMPGSSGSPVFNEDFDVVAIHHSGGLLKEPGSEQKYLRNEGITMAAVLADLQQGAAEIYERARRV